MSPSTPPDAAADASRASRVEVLHDGVPATACLDDRACQFGDGLFETLAVIDGQPCLWQRHLDRLSLGCERLRLPPPDSETLLAEARRLCAGRRRAVLKIVVGAGPGGRGYARPERLRPSRWLRCSDRPDDGAAPLRLITCSLRLAAQPRLAGIKHLNRLEQVLARAELPEDADEGLLLDRNGDVVEAIAANLLVRLDGRWLTPPIRDCGVDGTVRRHLLEAGPAVGLTVEEAPLQPETLRRAEALYLTSALLGIRPVARLDDHRYPDPERPPPLERLHRACFTFEGRP